MNLADVDTLTGRDFTQEVIDLFDEFEENRVEVAAVLLQLVMAVVMKKYNLPVVEITDEDFESADTDDLEISGDTFRLKEKNELS